VGVDTSKFEFTFDCETSPGERLRHSFGVGGFDEQEEFDTSIKCSKCIEPQPVSAHQEATKPSPVHVKASVSASPASTTERMDSRGVVEEETPMHVHFLSSKTEEKTKEATVKYGPDDCVSTWRDEKSGHCIVKTDCTGKDTTEYMFGLICEDDNGKTRHLFGKDSFDAKETFDTLIPCKKCLALDNVTKATELEAENAELAKEVEALATEVGTVKKTYEGIQSDVKKLNEAVAEKEGGGEKKEEKTEEKKEEAKPEEKKEEAKPEEKKEEEKAASFYLTDRDVDENLPYDSIVKSHLKGSASQVKKQRSSNQKKQRQRHQKTHEDEAEGDDNEDDDDAEDEDTVSQRNFRHASQKRSTAKEDNSDDTDDSSEDGNDD